MDRFAEEAKAYKFVIHSFGLTELCDLWCMTSQLRGARFSGKWSCSIWIAATAGVSSARLCFSVSHIHCCSIFLWHNGKGEVLDPISESMIRTSVVVEWIFWGFFFCTNPALNKTNVVHVLAAILRITKHGHGENRASWGRRKPNLSDSALLPRL